MHVMRFNQLLSLLTLSLFTAACPSDSDDTGSGITADSSGSTAVVATTGTQSSFSSTDTPTSAQPCHTSTGASSDTGASETSTGVDMGTSDTSGAVDTDSTSSSSTTDAPTTDGGGVPVCYMNTCNSNKECATGSICFAAIEALDGIKTCSIPCETTADCDNGCGGAPTAICSAQGICEPVVCEVGVDDCLCLPWINGVHVCA